MKTEVKYSSDLTNLQWQLIRQLLPRRSRLGRRPIDHRLIINAILYVVGTGYQWRMLPNDFLNWSRVYGIFWHWLLATCFSAVHAVSNKRDPLSAVIWVLVSVGVPFLGAWLYWIAGNMSGFEDV